MDKLVGSRKNSRHLPAFILLFLGERPANGADLLGRMEAEMPHCLADSAGLYRALQSLEEEGAVKANWETQEPGPPRKVYKMTSKGQAGLRALAEDIRMREENFRFFLNRFEAGRKS
jgi:DNA-binding PadR family transcriptional regulator